MKSRTSRIALTLAAIAMIATPLSRAAGPEGGMKNPLPGLFNPGDADKPFESGSVKYVPGKDRSMVETPCYRLVDGQGRHVELTGAIHVGDKSYYEGLNEHFKSFDAVLFECVGDDDKVKLMQSGAHPTGDKESPLSKIYRIFAHDLLSMDLQMEVVDYSRPNFVHADMGDTEFQALLASKGLTMDDLMMGGQPGGMKLSMDQIASMLPMLKLLLPKGDPAALKRMIAPMFIHLEAPEGSNGLLHELIVTDRNQRALEVLDRELAEGKKNISIFYGSAHLPEFLTSLHEKGWKDDGMEWRDAWVINAKQTAPVIEKTAAAADTAEAKPAENDSAAESLLEKAMEPFTKSKAVRFKTALHVKANALGQDISQEANADVVAMKPNLLLVHAKSAEGKTGTLISDGTTVTIFSEGAKSYRQFPAPATFSGFHDIAHLDEAGLDESNDIFPFLTMEESSASGEGDLKNVRRLEPATLNGAEHDRVQVEMDGAPAVLWLSRSGFPLEKIDVDTGKMLEQQLGEQAAGLKDMIKMEAWIGFSDGGVAESFPAETFRFEPAAGMSKE